MRSLVKEAGLEDSFEIDSAGTIGFHTGNPPDHRMSLAAKNRGIEMTGRARQVNAEDLKAFDWVFAMDNENFSELQALEKRTPEATARVVMFCEFCAEHSETEVPDPYYGGPEGFEKVLDLLEDGCTNFLKQWKDGTLK